MIENGFQALDMGNRMVTKGHETRHMIQINYNSKKTSLLLLRLIPSCPFCSYSVFREISDTKVFLLSFSLFFSHIMLTVRELTAISAGQFAVPGDAQITCWQFQYPASMLCCCDLLGPIIALDESVACLRWAVYKSALTSTMKSQKKIWLKKKGRLRHFATIFLEANSQISAPSTGNLMEQKTGNCSDQEIDPKKF